MSGLEFTHANELCIQSFFMIESKLEQITNGFILTCVNVLFAFATLADLAGIHTHTAEGILYPVLLYGWKVKLGMNEYDIIYLSKLKQILSRSRWYASSNCQIWEPFEWETS